VGALGPRLPGKPMVIKRNHHLAKAPLKYNVATPGGKIWLYGLMT